MSLLQLSMQELTCSCGLPSRAAHVLTGVLMH